MIKLNINEKIGIKIRLLRTKLKLSQEKLAEFSNLNKNTVGLIERGEISPTIETLEKIAKALDVEIKELVDVSRVEL